MKRHLENVALVNEVCKRSRYDEDSFNVRYLIPHTGPGPTGSIETQNLFCRFPCEDGCGFIIKDDHTKGLYHIFTVEYYYKFQGDVKYGFQMISYIPGRKHWFIGMYVMDGGNNNNGVFLMKLDVDGKSLCICGDIGKSRVAVPNLLQVAYHCPSNTIYAITHTGMLIRMVISDDWNRLTRLSGYQGNAICIYEFKDHIYVVKRQPSDRHTEENPDYIYDTYELVGGRTTRYIHSITGYVCYKQQKYSNYMWMIDKWGRWAWQIDLHLFNAWPAIRAMINDVTFYHK
jgi:hypothetical protein